MNLVNASGDVVCDTIVDLLIDEERKSEGVIDYHGVVMSLPVNHKLIQLGDLVVVWNKKTASAFCSCRVERIQMQFTNEPACKLEGKHITAVRTENDPCG